VVLGDLLGQVALQLRHVVNPQGGVGGPDSRRGEGVTSILGSC
jgi:hypothetical protein